MGIDFGLALVKAWEYYRKQHPDEYKKNYRCDRCGRFIAFADVEPTTRYCVWAYRE